MVALQAQGMSNAFHGEGCVGVHAVVAGCASFFHGMNQLLRSIELRHHAVNVRTMLLHPYSSEVSATNSRISAMEIAGRTRTNKKSSMTKNPMVPVNVAQSQKVGW